MITVLIILKERSYAIVKDCGFSSICWEDEEFSCPHYSCTNNVYYGWPFAKTQVMYLCITISLFVTKWHWNFNELVLKKIRILFHWNTIIVWLNICCFIQIYLVQQENLFFSGEESGMAPRTASPRSARGFP